MVAEEKIEHRLDAEYTNGEKKERLTLSGKDEQGNRWKGGRQASSEKDNNEKDPR